MLSIFMTYGNVVALKKACAGYTRKKKKNVKYNIQESNFLSCHTAKAWKDGRVLSLATPLLKRTHARTHTSTYSNLGKDCLEKCKQDRCQNCARRAYKDEKKPCSEAGAMLGLMRATIVPKLQLCLRLGKHERML